MATIETFVNTVCLGFHKYCMGSSLFVLTRNKRVVFRVICDSELIFHKYCQESSVYPMCLSNFVQVIHSSQVILPSDKKPLWRRVSETSLH
jgi:hypothetical protein